MWTKDDVHELIQTRLADHRLIVVANRAPCHHRYAAGRIECVPPASGMVSALEPIMRACGGIWVAHGSGNADRRTVDAHDHIAVPPDDPKTAAMSGAHAGAIPDASSSTNGTASSARTTLRGTDQIRSVKCTFEE